EIFRTAGMRPLMAEELVAELVAGGDHHVMDTAGTVLGDSQHRPAEARDQRIALAWAHRKGRHPGMIGRQPLSRVFGVVGEEIGRLRTLRCCDPNVLTRLYPDGTAFAGRYGDVGHDA